MKIKTAMSYQDEQPIFVYRVGIWQAASWCLTNTPLAQELTKRAYDAAGIPLADPMVEHKQTFKGAPEWAFEVELKASRWKECV